MKRDWNNRLYFDVRYALFRIVAGGAKPVKGKGLSIPQLDQSERLDILAQFDAIDLRLSVLAHGFVRWLYQIWKVIQHQLVKSSRLG